MSGASPGNARERHSPMLFEELLESSPDAIIVTDLEGRITGANAHLEKLFGFYRSELLGQPVETLIPERFRSAHPAHRRTFHTEPRMRPMGVGVELYARRKDGSEFPVDIMLSPVETTEGRAVLSVIHDITEKKRAEEALRKSEEQLRRLAESTARQRDELAEEIRLAAEVQQNILPQSIPAVPGFEFAARMYPARIVAGDYYGFLELPDGKIGLVVADVSGKGVAAGLLMPSIEVVLRMDAPRFPRTNDLLGSFNNVVHQITGADRFISLFYGKLSPQARSLEYTNAGHNPPLVIRGSRDPIPLDKGGPVLGMIQGSGYESDQIDLQTGDVLVLFTDGVVEAENPDGEEYTAKRLAGIVSSHLQQSPGELIETIHASVIQFRQTTVLADDFTLVVLKTL